MSRSDAVNPAFLRLTRIEDEPEKRCQRCGDWWPITSEFWRTVRSGNLAGTCRACHLEMMSESRRRAKKRRGERVRPLPISRSELTRIVIDATDQNLKWRASRLLRNFA